MELNILQNLEIAAGIFDLLPVAIFVKDAHSNFKVMNKACQENWGIQFAEIENTNGSRFFPDDQMQLFLGNDSDVFAGRVTVEFEETFWSTKYQSNRVGLTTKKPFYDEYDQPKFLLCVTKDITDIRKATHDLKVSEEKLSKLFDMSPIGIARNSMDGTFFEANPAFLDIVGYSLSELTKLSYWDLTPEKYREQEQKQIESLHTANEYGPYEKEYINSNKAVVPVKLNGVVITDDRSEPYIWSFVENITEHKRITEQIRESEARLRMIADSVPVSLALNDKFGRITFLNQGFKDTIGYTHDEIPVLEAWWQRAYPDESYRQYILDTWQKRLDEALRTHTPFKPMEADIHCKDGQVRTFLASATLFANSLDGLHLVSLIDITEQKRAAQKILESKLFLQKIIDSTPDWVFAKDRNHRFILANASFAAAFGQDPLSMIGRLDTDVMPMEMCLGDPVNGIPGFHHDDLAVLNGDSIHDPVFKWITADGQVRYFDLVKVPMRNAALEVTSILCYEREITGRVVAEQNQKALQTQLWQAQKMELIGQLTGGIAHDFNNILAAMLGYSELLEMSPEVTKNATLSRYIHEILKGGHRARELVGHLISFSRKTSIAKEEISVEPIVTEVMKLLQSTMPSSILTKTEIVQPLGPVLISPVNLHQILMNLCINARDSLGESGVITVTVSMVSLDDKRFCMSCHTPFDGHYIKISVADNGSGISNDNLLKIFEPFYTTKDMGLGSGLGLAVVHGIVHSAQGHIEVLTQPGCGSEFCIYLPSKTMPHVALAGPDVSNPAMTRLTGTVMVVDDELTLVGFMTELLEGAGCRVIGLTSSFAALRRFSADPGSIDLVITDQNMPELTGVKLAHAIQEIRPGIPVIITTGYVSAADEESVRQAGIREILIKPVPSMALVRCVAAYLKR